MAGVETIAAVEIDLYNLTTLSIVTHYFAERSFVTRSTDAPANTVIRGRLIGPIEVERAIRSGPGNFFGSLIDMTFSSLVFANDDGALDALMDDYSSDGREVRIKVGTVAHRTAWQLQPVGAPVGENVFWAIDGTDVDTMIVEAGGDELIFEAEGFEGAGEVASFYDADEVESYAGFDLAFRCVAGQWEADEQFLRLRLKDPGIALQGPMQVGQFSGGGAWTGTPALKGTTKPFALGYCRHVPMVQIDEFYSLWAVHAGAVQTITFVLDAGVFVPIQADMPDYTALINTPVDPGKCLVSTALGMVIFETVPSLPTAIVEGDNSTADIPPWWRSPDTFWPDDNGVLRAQLDGYHQTAAGIIRRVLVAYGRGPAHDQRIDLASFNAHAAAFPAVAGWFLEAGGADSCEDVIEAIAYGAGAVVGPDRLNNYQIWALRSPAAATPVATFTEEDILEIERLPLPWGIAPWKYEIGFERTWRVHTDSEIAGGDLAEAAYVNPETRQELSHEFRILSAENEAQWRASPSSTPHPLVPGVWQTEAVAQVDLDTRWDLYWPTRQLYRLRVATSILSLNLGNTVMVTYPRFGLGGGRKLLIVRIHDSVGGDNTSCEFHGFG